MKIKCIKCQKIFEPDKKQNKILENAISKRIKRLIFMECPICLKDSYVDPFDLLNEKDITNGIYKKSKSDMEIKCPSCLKTFIPNNEDKIFINESIKKGQKLCMIECTECYKTIPINPYNLLEIMDTQTKEEIIYCPICKDGIISHIKNETEDFFGCGECGNVWKNIEEINNKK